MKVELFILTSQLSLFFWLNSSSTPSNYLEFDCQPAKSVDYTQIISQNKKNAQLKAKATPEKERENSANFIDDPDVPPLI